jgi:hypothetical protein
MLTADRFYPIWKGAGECVRWRARKRAEVLPWVLAKFPSPFPASSPYTILARFLNCSASVLGENHRSIRRAHITDWFFLWCSVDGWGAMLQARRSRVRVLMRSIIFFPVDLMLPATLWLLGLSTSNRNEYQEIFWGVKCGRRVRLTI